MGKIRIANRNAGEHVARREDFEGSHLFSETTTKNAGGFRQVIREAIGEPLEVYAVYSYGYHWPLFAFIAGVWYENREKYSPTTSKQKGQARPRGVSSFVEMGTEELKSLIGR